VSENDTYFQNKEFKSLFFATLRTSFHRNNLTMLLLYDKRKKESLMKFPTITEVKLNGYMWGGGGGGGKKNTHYIEQKHPPSEKRGEIEYFY